MDRGAPRHGHWRSIAQALEGTSTLLHVKQTTLPHNLFSLAADRRCNCDGIRGAQCTLQPLSWSEGSCAPCDNCSKSSTTRPFISAPISSNCKYGAMRPRPSTQNGRACVGISPPPDPACLIGMRLHPSTCSNLITHFSSFSFAYKKSHLPCDLCLLQPQLDSASSCCDDAACSKVFGFFERRHHCRKCGNIFCGEHSSHEVPLDQKADFHPHAAKFRACNGCGAEYRAWEVARVSRSNSTNSRDSTTPGTPTVAVNRPNRTGFGAQKVGSLAKSVPSDWHWSTF
jgi:hypothetical protein